MSPLLSSSTKKKSFNRKNISDENTSTTPQSSEKESFFKKASTYIKSLFSYSTNNSMPSENLISSSEEETIEPKIKHPKLRIKPLPKIRIRIPNIIKKRKY